MSYTHGTYKAYATHGCRCDACRAYQNDRNARNRAERLAEGRLSHGRKSAYDAGCRCRGCLTARQATYEAENAARRAKGGAV